MHYRTSSYSSGKWDVYWFERNLHGDVVAIYNNSNTKLASYLYDAWGNHTVTYHNGGGSLTAIVNNPIRYRGYYYDIDLGLYYLQSRYYDSNIGRFINADGYISTGSGLVGYNMYAYCNNNPVMYVDPSGDFPIAAVVEILKGFLFLVTALFMLDAAANVEVPKTITKSESSAKADEKETTIVNSTQKHQAYFTENPLDFNPNGLERIDLPGELQRKNKKMD